MAPPPPQALPATPPPSGRPPDLTITPNQVTNLLPELKRYHERFSPLFRRKEQRRWSLLYMQGQFMEIRRKSIAPIAWAVEGGDKQGLHEFIAVGSWDDEAILEEHRRFVAETLGHPDGGLIIDGTSFPKKGTYSVGVARQWCGALGKVANCQTSVLAAYASPEGCTPVDFRLYLPESWFEEAYQERWERCRIPEGTTFRTQPELAGDMIERLHREQVLPFRWVTIDEQFGQNTVLLDRIRDAGLWYLAEVPHSTQVWARRPRTSMPPRRPRGRPPSRAQLASGEPPAVRVDELARRIEPDQWQSYRIKEGAKGPLVAEFAALRAVAVRDKLPAQEVWVIFRRKLGPAPELKVYLSNAPADTPLETFVYYSGMRWPIETAIEEAKSELGMDHYEVRGWKGWHHHMTMTLLSHHLLIHMREKLKKTLQPLL